MSIQVNDFRWEPGENDAEYIRLLESSRDEWQKIAQKAIAKLKTLSKAKQPHVMTISEMNDKRGRGEAVYYEDRDATCKSQDVFVIAPDKEIDVVWLKAEMYTLAAKMSTMGKSWRCWTSRPTDEQREAVKWE